MKTAEEILESHLTSMLSRTEDSYVTIDEMKQASGWETCVKAIEQIQKEAYNEAWEHAIALRARIGNPYNERESKDMLDFEIEARKLKK